MSHGWVENGIVKTTCIDEQALLFDAKILFETAASSHENILIHRRTFDERSEPVALRVGGVTVPQREDNYLERLLALMVKIGIIDEPQSSNEDEYVWVYIYDPTAISKLERLSTAAETKPEQVDSITIYNS